jgi:hypothetical protein
MKLLFYLLTLLVFPLSLFAQSEGKLIKVVVLDSLSKKPLEYVTIKVSDSVERKAVLTNAAGEAALNNLKGDTYQVGFFAVGYNSLKKRYTFNATASPLVDTIYLSIKSTNLKEVTVTANRPLLKHLVDRLVYDVTADPENKTQSLIEILRKVPMLSVDGTEQLTMNGSTNYKILLNGKSSTLTTNNPQNLLRSMAASNIQSIEVITNPPAKYDADGLAGIINIITVKKTVDGYSGNIGGRMNFVYGPTANGSIVLKQGKFGISLFAGESWRNSPSSTVFQQNTGISPSVTLTQTGFDKSNSNSPYANLDLSYEIDSLNLIAGSFNISNDHIDDKKNFTTATGQNSAILNSYNLISQNRHDAKSLNLALNYQLGFKRNKNQLFTASYQYRTFPDDMRIFTEISEGVNISDQAYEQINNSGNHEHTGQLDFVLPFKNATMETGVKGIFRDNYSNYDFNEQIPGTNTFINNRLNSDEFSYRQGVYSAYNSWQINIKKWTFKGGIRLENTRVDADFISSQNNVHQNYTNIIPVISIQHDLKNATSINIGFTQRIERPAISILNPFVNQLDPKFISIGNPNLREALVNRFSASFSSYQTISVDLTLFYSYYNNRISNINLYDDATGVTTNTYINTGAGKNLGTNLSFGIPISKKINANVNSNLRYLWINGPIENVQFENSGLQGDASASLGYTISTTWRANVNFGYRSRFLYLQGESNDNFYSTFGVTKKIFNKRGSVSLTLANPQQHFYYFKDSFSTTRSYQVSSYQNYYRQVLFGFNYTFGKLKDQLKKNQRSIDNDDLRDK